MSAAEPIFSKPNRRIAALALCVLICDQISKWLVLQNIDRDDEITIIPGFFNLTYRVNTGAAWSRFTGHNAALAAIAITALVILYLTRRHFSAHRLLGQFAFGLIFGGITGNLADRLLPGRHAVVDFLHFYMARRGTSDFYDFPAFNVADSAICVGVALIFLLNWKEDPAPATSDA
ncbi:MAG TPA: signal peptidase II [Verrucomicrobiae bacterium]|jgi:signal peptidase II|nr:signal peptidase II [Verrucomicrobiae bacterium]